MKVVQRHVLLLLVGAAIVLSPVASATNERGQGAAPVLRVGIYIPPRGLDPSTNANADFFNDLFNEPLIHMNLNGSFAPALATSWEYLHAKAKSGRANKDFQLTLRHDARFSDGEQVNAAAVAGWLTYMAKGTGPFGSQFGVNPTFQAVGNWTVQIHLETPNPDIPYLLSEPSQWSSVQAPQAVANPSLMASETYGAGQYVLDSSRTVSGSSYTFVPNQYYYDKSAIKWSEVDVKVIPDLSTMLQAMQSGQIDVAQGDASTVSGARAAGLQIVGGPQATDEMLFADRNGTLAPALKDVRVRQAMNYAVDRKAIVSGVLHGYGYPTSETFTTAKDPKYIHYYPYDPAKAKALLAAAGYPNGFTFNMVDFQPGLAIGDILWQAVDKYLAAVGIQMNIQTDVNPTPDRLSGKFSAWTTGVGNQPTPLAFPIYGIPSSAFVKVFNVYDPTEVKLYYAGLKASGSASLRDWKQLWGHVVEQADFLPVAAFLNLYYVNPKVVRGVRTSAARVGEEQPHEWYPA